jgi:hypothetical protein
VNSRVVGTRFGRCGRGCRSFWLSAEHFLLKAYYFGPLALFRLITILGCAHREALLDRANDR